MGEIAHWCRAWSRGSLARVSSPDGPTPTSPGLASRFAGYLVRAVALLLVIGLVAGVGAAIVLAWPEISARYLAPVQANTAEVAVLRDRVAELQRKVDDLTAADAAIGTRLKSIDDRIAEHDRLLAGLRDMDVTLGSADAAVRVRLARQVGFLKAMELLSRARLYLFESNFGLAAQDARDARTTLIGMRPAAAGDEASLDAAIDALDRTVAALPGFPVPAVNYLDAAWQALLVAAPNPGPVASPAPSQGPSPIPSQGASPAPSAEASRGSPSSAPSTPSAPSAPSATSAPAATPAAIPAETATPSASTVP